MTKKEIKLIAAAMQENKPPQKDSWRQEMDQWKNDVKAIGRIMMEINPGFNILGFHQDCGMD
jgi:hypothetical protein